jgi:uncharacterized protein
MQNLLFCFKFNVMIFRLLFLVVLFLIIEIYSFQAFKTIFKTKWIPQLYIAISIAVIIYVVYNVFQFDRKIGQTQQSLFTFGLVLLVLIPKCIVAFVLFGEDLFRVLYGSFKALSQNRTDDFLPARRKFISQIGLGLAAIPFLSLIYGITIGKYNFKIIKQNVFFPDLPDAFHDFTITHISDIHSGSFDNPEKIEYAIDLINQQKSDIILFTGDIVNAKAEEMYPWIDTFKKIHKPEFGKFSILGNHDYGAYLEWDSEAEKAQNFIDIKKLHNQIDFKLLMNEHVIINKNNDKLAIVGVENWGKMFGEFGDVDKATKGIVATDFKVLMSHDPSHWEEIVKNHAKNIQLTLSGHTHGMQFGIEIPGWFKWSIAQYMYKQWAGLYEHVGRYVYVNRGFGFHAYPGRVGIMPEITVLRLKKGVKDA